MTTHRNTCRIPLPRGLCPAVIVDELSPTDVLLALTSPPGSVAIVCATRSGSFVVVSSKEPVGPQVFPIPPLQHPIETQRIKSEGIEKDAGDPS